MNLSHEKATEEEIVSQCAWSDPTRIVLHEIPGGYSVIRIGDAVVKYGFGITQEEALNQSRAYNLID